jgi:serine/arginine repetitive matrix protein 2
LRRSGSGRGTIASPTMITSIAGPAKRPNHSRRGSFMSLLRRKKPEVNNKVRKSDAESPARRDTPLERSKSDLAALRVERPSTPRLQKRHAAWPLPVLATPPKIAGGEDGRPFSADDGVGGETGVNGSTAVDGRPDIGTRRFTATGLANVDVGLNGIGAARKKKKFGALRRMFRLDE